MTEDDYTEMLIEILAADYLIVYANWSRDPTRMLSTGMCAEFYHPVVDYRAQDSIRQLEMTSADNIASVCIDIVQGYKLPGNRWDIIGPDQQL